jgi:hypothetical protein
VLKLHSSQGWKTTKRFESTKTSIKFKAENKKKRHIKKGTKSIEKKRLDAIHFKKLLSC